MAETSKITLHAQIDTSMRAKKITPVEMDKDDLLAFYRCVKKREGHDCYQWIGGLDGRGYGRMRFKGGVIAAHRIAWHLTHGAIPAGKVLRHHLGPRCNNRGCVRPDHLEIVPLREARARGGRRSQQTHREASGVSVPNNHDEQIMLHVKHGSEKLAASLFRSREEKMIESLVTQGDTREKLWAAALSALQGQLAQAAKHSAELVTEMAAIRSSVASIAETKPAPAVAVPAPSSEEPPAPPPPANDDTSEDTLEERLVGLLAPVAGNTPDQYGDSAKKRILAVFERALTEAGGNGNGGLQVFFGWLKEWEATVQPGERSLESFEKLTT